MPLIDYKLSGVNTPKRYNGITVFPPKDGAPTEEDPFHVSESKGGVVPDNYVSKYLIVPYASCKSYIARCILVVQKVAYFLSTET